MRDDKDQSPKGNVPLTPNLAKLVPNMQGFLKIVEPLVGVIAKPGRREGKT